MGQTKRLAEPIALTIEYEDAEGETTTRPIEIEAIGTGKNGVFFEAECGLRNCTRTFLIHRITAVIDEDGVVHDPAPIIGQVLMQAQAAGRSQAGRTRRQRDMDEANAQTRAAKTTHDPEMARGEGPNPDPDEEGQTVTRGQVFRTAWRIAAWLSAAIILIGVFAGSR